MKNILPLAALIAALSLAWIAVKGVDVRGRVRNFYPPSYLTE
jgi:hypothetical protein